MAKLTIQKQADGCLTPSVNGMVLEGVRKIELVHDAADINYPTVTLTLFARDVIIREETESP